MTRTNRTNPAYAYIAYRRAIIQHLSTLLVREYTAPLNEEAEQKIFSDEVMRGDDEVPMGEIFRYIEELNREDADLLLEMNKFEFRRIEEPKLSGPIEPPALPKDSDESAKPKEPSNGSGPTAPPQPSN